MVLFPRDIPVERCSFKDKQRNSALFCTSMFNEHHNPAAIRERLHDGLCQQLTGALMFARVLADALEKRDDPLAQDSETLFRMLNEAADEVHALMNVIDTSSSPVKGPQL